MTATWRFRIEVPPDAGVTALERLVAELWSLQTLGLEETKECVLSYFGGSEPPELRRLLEHVPGLVIGVAERVPDEDWESEWRRGLAPRQVGSLWIRPSWCESKGEPELVIDPRQAFGSGEHATTRLSLSLLLETLRASDRVLDVGTGSGILLLGAMRFGANGIGFDVDPVACANARDNALANELRAPIFCGTLDALARTQGFDVVVANMLLGRLEPLVPRLRDHAQHTLILSGYLVSERERLHALLNLGHGVDGAGGAEWTLEREEREAQSGDVWCASCWSHARALHASRSSSSISSTE